MKCLVSVYDKTGLVPFCKGLLGLGYEIISTGGTLRHLIEEGVHAISVTEVTGFPEILDGRVKTLNPRLHGGILASRDKPEHMSTLREHNIPTIDLVVCNFYPFADNITDSVLKMKEFIDIGGPSMVRAAAKNFPDVVPVVEPVDYEAILAQLQKGKVEHRFHLGLIAKVFKCTSQFDALVSEYFTTVSAMDAEVGGDTSVADLASFIAPAQSFLQKVNLTEKSSFRYGENPHQQGFIIPGSAPFTIVQGKEMSYNNYLDFNSCVNIVRGLPANIPGIVIIKHLNPCGVSIATDAELDESLESCLVHIFNRAKACDPVSYFGGIIGVNCEVTEALAGEISKDFFEIVVAPSYTQGALAELGKKKNLRVIILPRDYYLSNQIDPFSVRSTFDGGAIIQENDKAFYEDFIAEVASATKYINNDLDFNDYGLAFSALLSARVASNCIVITDGFQALGIGAGQMSRIDSAKLAVERAQRYGHNLEGAIAASDAFFPFPDSVTVLGEGGVKAIVSPSGSVKDKLAIEECERLGINLYLTSFRHFRH